MIGTATVNGQIRGSYSSPPNGEPSGIFGCSAITGSVCTVEIPAGAFVRLSCDQPGMTFDLPIYGITPPNSCTVSGFPPSIQCNVFAMTSPVSVSMGWGTL
jgi:hypothetical protein